MAVYATVPLATTHVLVQLDGKDGTAILVGIGLCHARASLLAAVFSFGHALHGCEGDYARAIRLE